MARPSVTHPQGPGDPPRRKKRGRTPSSDAGASTTSSRRTSSPTLTRETKRAKRAVANDEEQITIETTAALVRTEQIEEIIVRESNPSRRPRHSDPGPVANGEDNDDDAEAEDTFPSETPERPLRQLTNGLTPHLKRIGANARPTKSSRHRMSMPAHLGSIQEDGEQEIQFTPLRSVLDGRMKRRLRRNHLSEEVNTIEEHRRADVRAKQELIELRNQVAELTKQIKELEYQKEAAQLGNIDINEDQTRELEVALAQANEELAELKASSVYATSVADYDDDEMDGVELVEPDDLHVSQEEMVTQPHPNGYYASLANSQVELTQSASATQHTINDSQGEVSVQTDLSDRISDRAVQRFQALIRTLQRDLGEAHAALRIIGAELQNLHVVKDGATSDHILTTLRHTFENAREQLDSIFGPGSVANLNNSQMVEKMIEHIRGLMAELKEKVTLTEQHNKMEKVLRTQNSGLLDMLAESDLRCKDLEKKLTSVDMKTDEQQRRIIELEQDLTTSQDLAKIHSAQIEENGIKLHALEDERVELETTVQRLTSDLDLYRKDIEDFAARIEELETANSAQAEAYELQSEELQRVQSELETETAERATAENTVEEQATEISTLQGRVLEFESEILRFQDDISDLQTRLAEEKAQRNHAVEERDERALTVIQLSDQLTLATDNISELRQEANTLRTNLTTALEQLQTTEGELEGREEQIDELQGQIHDLGIQTNELRSKLFEVQMQKDKTIAELKASFEATQAELENKLDKETQAHTQAEDQIDELQAQIKALETALKEARSTQQALTKEKDVMVDERNARIRHVESALADLEHKLSMLKQTTAMEITTLQATIRDLNNEVAVRNAQIEKLNEDAVVAMENFEQQLDERDATINHLQHELKSTQDQNSNLETEVRSLEGRVDHEANELLKMANVHSNEVDGLRAKIKNQDKTIAQLEANAQAHEAEFSAELTRKTQELEELQVIATTRAGDITALVSQIEEMRELFRKRDEDARNTIALLQEAQREMVARNEQLSAGLLERNGEVLKNVMQMKTKGVKVQTNGVELRKVANGRVSKIKDTAKVSKAGRKKKRQFDSGFGVASDEEEEEVPEMEQVNGNLLFH